MALELDLSYSQSNNAVSLTITDTAGEYDVTDNPTGWGTPNERYENIEPATYGLPFKRCLFLTVTVTDKSNVSTTYDAIDLYTHNGGAFASAAELTWTFNPAHFTVGSEAMGESTDRLTDGVWDINYKLTDSINFSTIYAELSESIKIDGDVRLDVYNQLRQVPTDYDCEHNDKSKEHMDALMSYTYLQAIEAASSISEKQSIISQLFILDKMVSDGSKYTW